MDLAILEYQTTASTTLQQSFFETLLNDACKKTLMALSDHYKPLCESVQESIIVTGIDKVSNHLAHSIQNLNSNLQQTALMDDKFFSLFQL